jgi:Xaa-Pro dipeptidase
VDVSGVTGSSSIPKSEFFGRIEKLRAAMREHRLHAILLGTGMNLQYFSGFPSPQKNVTRPFFLLIPISHDPILLCHTGLADEGRRLSVIEDVRVYEGLSQAPVKAIGDLLTEIRAHAGRIGMELGFEQTLDISLLEFNRLHTSLPAAELTDAAGLLWSLRTIKSESEISCVREACRIVAESYGHTFASAHAGMREREIYQTMLGGLSAPGGETFLAITSGSGNYDLVSKHAEDRIVQQGELFWMDAGCRVGGYWSDYSRAGVMGAPSALQMQAQEAIHEITMAAVQQVRPGVKCSQIAQFCFDRLNGLPFPITSSIAVRAGRVGHGIGLNMTEPPHLSLQDDTPLQMGMIVSLEPGVATAYGTFHVEENVVVREDGCELLSVAPRHLVPIL